MTVGRRRAHPLQRSGARQRFLRGRHHHPPRAELTQSETKLTRANDQAIRRTLEAAGVEFIDAEGSGPGVRLRKQHESRGS